MESGKFEHRIELFEHQPELADKLTAYSFRHSRPISIRFEDGSNALFMYAFLKIEGKDGEFTVVYTEHCGYLIFMTSSIKSIFGTVFDSSVITIQDVKPKRKKGGK